MDSSAVFLSAGGYYHHIGLNTWESQGGSPPPPGSTGLYRGLHLEGAADHGVSHALYLRDPDGNGVELYWDLPASAWPRDADRSISMYTKPLNLEALLATLEGAEEERKGS
jgi:catechol 2,3-dioxygenase